MEDKKPAPHGIKQPIFDRYWAYRHEEREARIEALRGHKAKFRETEQSIIDACAASGGHDWMGMPSHEDYARHFLTGEPSMVCKWCRVARPHGWTE